MFFSVVIYFVMFNFIIRFLGFGGNRYKLISRIG